MRRLFIICLIFVLWAAFPAAAQDDEGDNPLIYTLRYGEKMLDDPWYLFWVEDRDLAASFGWTDDSSSVVTITHFTFPDPDLIPTYFDETYFDTSFLNYSPYEAVQECETSKVGMADFTGIYGDTPYNIRHYHWALTHNTVLAVNLYIPASEPDWVEAYSALFQPDFIECPVERR